MKVVYTGRETREFGGRIAGQKFRVPVESKDENGQTLPRLVHFVTIDEDGQEKVSTDTTKAIGEAFTSTTVGDKPKNRKLIYAEYVEEKSTAGQSFLDAGARVDQSVVDKAPVVEDVTDDRPARRNRG